MAFLMPQITIRGARVGVILGKLVAFFSPRWHLLSTPTLTCGTLEHLINQLHLLSCSIKFFLVDLIFFPHLFLLGETCRCVSCFVDLEEYVLSSTTVGDIH